MALKATTVRFSSDAYVLVQGAAANLEMSTAQFIREAAIMRAFITLEDPRAQAVIDAVRELENSIELRRLARPR